MTVGLGDGTIVVWSIETETQLNRFKRKCRGIGVFHHDPVVCLSFGKPDTIMSGTLISTSYDKECQIKDKTTGQLLHVLKHDSEYSNFDLNSTGTLLAICHLRGVSIWSCKTMNKIGEIEIGIVTDVRFNTDSTRLISLKETGEIYCTELK